MFETAGSRLEPWFKDANAAGVFRESLFEGWQPDLVGLCLEILLAIYKGSAGVGRPPSCAKCSFEGQG